MDRFAPTEQQQRCNQKMKRLHISQRDTKPDIPAHIPAGLPTASAKSVGAQMATDPKFPLVRCTTALCTSFNSVYK